MTRVAAPPMRMPAPAQVPRLCLRRFSASEFRRMRELGIVNGRDRVSWQDGYLVRKTLREPVPEVLVCPEPGSRTSPYPALPIHRFTVEEYHRLLDAGILREGEPSELLEGWVVVKMGRNAPHDLSVSLAENEIERRLPRKWIRRVQSGVTTSRSEPEPDVAVVRGPRRRYARRHPGPRDTALAVEASDSTLEHDRTIKAAVYARDRIPVYWIINIPERQVEVYTDPTGPGPFPVYRQRRDYKIGQSVPLVLDGELIGRIPVRNLLP